MMFTMLEWLQFQREGGHGQVISSLNLHSGSLGFITSMATG